MLAVGLIFGQAPDWIFQNMLQFPTLAAASEAVADDAEVAGGSFGAAADAPTHGGTAVAVDPMWATDVQLSNM